MTTARSARSRRTPRTTGDERERAILETAERLLGERALADISIDDLARGAGISRSTFYFYFASKDAVLLALLDAVVAEVDAATERLAMQAQDRWGGAEPDGARELWRGAIEVVYRAFDEHRAVAVAAAQLRESHQEGRALWAGVMSRWVRRTEVAIEAERARGAAPDGESAHDIAVALNLMNERVLSATFSEETPAIPAERVVDVLHRLWLAAIYDGPR